MILKMALIMILRMEPIMILIKEINMKKILVSLVILLIPLYAYSAKLTSRAEDTAPASTDFTHTLDDTIGTPVSKKTTHGNVLKLIQGDVNVDNTGASTIQADSVALTTDTTGNYAAGDAEAGAALTGDTATAFFGAGTIEHERGGIEADISAIADGGILVGTGAGTMGIRAATFTAGVAGFLTHEVGGIEANISAIADGGMLVGTGAGTMAIRASFLTAGAAGFITHELGGLEAAVNAYSAIVGINAGSTLEVNLSSEIITLIDDETGSGALMFGTSPSITTSILAVAQANIGSAAAEFGDIFIGDGKDLQMGDDQDVLLTHIADVGVLLTGTTDEQFQIGDSGTYLNQSVDGTLSLVGDTIIDITAPNIKLAFDAAAYLNIATADGGITTISQVSDGTDEIKLGDGSDLISVASGNWAVSNAGVFSGLTGIASTGVIDFGATTSQEINNAANNTVDAEGEVTIDTTDGQAVYYGNGAVRVLQETDYKCAIIESLAAADDNLELWMANDACTVISAGVHCAGTCTTPAEITMEDRAGNAFTMAVPTVSTGAGNTTFATVTSDAVLVAGEAVRFDVDNAVSPETDTYSICIGVKYNRQ